MANKMERFTNDARLVLNRSQKFAEDLKHPLIEPEHLLLGLAAEKDLIAYEILDDAGIVLEKLLPVIKNRMPEHPPIEKLDLSPATKKTLELAVVAARENYHGKIHSTHLLAGLLRLEHQGIVRILEHFQVEKKEILKALSHYWDENPDDVGMLRIGHPLNPVADNEMGCLEVLRQSFGFRKKKNDE